LGNATVTLPRQFLALFASFRKHHVNKFNDLGGAH
jgi:hypothetical protein